MARYDVTVDKKTDIKSDANWYCDEVDDKKYIFNLLLRVIRVFVESVELINKISKVRYDE